VSKADHEAYMNTNKAAEVVKKNHERYLRLNKMGNTKGLDRPFKITDDEVCKKIEQSTGFSIKSNAKPSAEDKLSAYLLKMKKLKEANSLSWASM